MTLLYSSRVLLQQWLVVSYWSVKSDWSVLSQSWASKPINARSAGYSKEFGKSPTCISCGRYWTNAKWIGARSPRPRSEWIITRVRVLSRQLVMLSQSICRDDPSLVHCANLYYVNVLTLYLTHMTLRIS